MFAHRTRKTVLAGVSLLAAGMLVSACGPENGSPDASGAGSGSGSSHAQSSSKDSNGGKTSDANGAHGAGASSSQGGAANAGGPGSKGYHGALEGDVEYMAPGKFIVKPDKGMAVAFYIEKGAKITGWGTLCGNPGQQTTCTEQQLESATKQKAVPASVTLDGGTASAVTEHKPGTAGGDADTGVSGQRVGNVRYLAPQKFTVQGAKGPAQAFYASNATVITGAGRICGEKGTTHNCTEGQLESATKGSGVHATVTLKDGAATAVTETH